MARLEPSEGPPPLPAYRGPGCFVAALGFFVLGVMLCWILFAVVAPWNYVYGGHFHVVPGWQGSSILHSNSAGGDYFLWVRITPSTPGYGKSDIEGFAYLCTPRGERYRLTVGGALPPAHPVYLTGLPLHFYMFNSRALDPKYTGDRGPQLDFYGTFGDSELKLEDRGSLATAFAPDGALVPQRTVERPRTRENLTFTLEQSTLWTMGPACPATHK